MPTPPASNQSHVLIGAYPNECERSRDWLSRRTGRHLSTHFAARSLSDNGVGLSCQTTHRIIANVRKRVGATDKTKTNQHTHKKREYVQKKKL